MPTLVSLAAASVMLTAAPAQDQTPAAVTLGDGVRAVFTDKSYAVEYGAGLENSPILFSLAKRTTPKQDLASLCEVLFLKCEFDEGKRTVSIAKSPRLLANERARQIRERVTALASEIRPFLNAEPKKTYQSVQSLSKLAQAERDARARQRLSWRYEALQMLLDSESDVLARSVAANPDNSTRTFTQPCSINNYLPISADANRSLVAFLQGRGLRSSDYRDASEERPEIWQLRVEADNEMRRSAAQLGERQPIALIKHSATSQEFFCGLFIVTPQESVLRASMKFNLAPPSRSLALLPAEVARVAIKPEAVDFMGRNTLNSLGTVAQKLKLNYASWLTLNTVVTRDGQTLEQYREQGYPIEAKLTNGWLGLYDATEPLTLTSPAWATFLKLRRFYESNWNQPEKMHRYLEGLKRTEVGGLEEIGSSYASAIPSRYQPIAAGIRLYRAALRAQVANPEVATEAKFEYERLPEGAREDLRDFLRSAFAFQYCPQLLHPANTGNFRKTTLTIRRTQKDGVTATHLGIEFSKDWSPIAKNAPISFAVRDPQMNG